MTSTSGYDVQMMYRQHADDVQMTCVPADDVQMMCRQHISSACDISPEILLSCCLHIICMSSTIGVHSDHGDNGDDMETIS